MVYCDLKNSRAYIRYNRIHEEAAKNNVVFNACGDPAFARCIHRVCICNNCHDTHLWHINNFRNTTINSRDKTVKKGINSQIYGVINNSSIKNPNKTNDFSEPATPHIASNFRGTLDIKDYKIFRSTRTIKHRRMNGDKNIHLVTNSNKFHDTSTSTYTKVTGKSDSSTQVSTRSPKKCGLLPAFPKFESDVKKSINKNVFTYITEKSANGFKSHLNKPEATSFEENMPGGEFNGLKNRTKFNNKNYKNIRSKMDSLLRVGSSFVGGSTALLSMILRWQHKLQESSRNYSEFSETIRIQGSAGRWEGREAGRERSGRQRKSQIDFIAKVAANPKDSVFKRGFAKGSQGCEKIKNGICEQMDEENKDNGDFGNTKSTLAKNDVLLKKLKKEENKKTKSKLALLNLHKCTFEEQHISEPTHDEFSEKQKHGKFVDKKVKIKNKNMSMNNDDKEKKLRTSLSTNDCVVKTKKGDCKREHVQKRALERTKSRDGLKKKYRNIAKDEKAGRNSFFNVETRKGLTNEKNTSSVAWEEIDSRRSRNKWSRRKKKAETFLKLSKNPISKKVAEIDERIKIDKKLSEDLSIAETTNAAYCIRTNLVEHKKTNRARPLHSKIVTSTELLLPLFKANARQLNRLEKTKMTTKTAEKTEPSFSPKSSLMKQPVLPLLYHTRSYNEEVNERKKINKHQRVTTLNVKSLEKIKLKLIKKPQKKTIKSALAAKKMSENINKLGVKTLQQPSNESTSTAATNLISSLLFPLTFMHRFTNFLGFSNLKKKNIHLRNAQLTSPKVQNLQKIARLNYLNQESFQREKPQRGKHVRQTTIPFPENINSLNERNGYTMKSQRRSQSQAAKSLLTMHSELRNTNEIKKSNEIEPRVRIPRDSTSQSTNNSQATTTTTTTTKTKKTKTTTNTKTNSHITKTTTKNYSATYPHKEASYREANKAINPTTRGDKIIDVTTSAFKATNNSSSHYIDTKIANYDPISTPYALPFQQSTQLPQKLQQKTLNPPLQQSEQQKKQIKQIEKSQQKNSLPKQQQTLQKQQIRQQSQQQQKPQQLQLRQASFRGMESTPQSHNILPLHYSVFEEVKKGWRIADLINDSGLSDRLKTMNESRSRVKLKLINLQPSLAARAIRLDEKVGHIVVSNRLDRDEWCASSETCQV